MLFPKFNHGEQGRWGWGDRSVDSAHVLLSEALHSLCRFGAVAGVTILLAKPVRALHPLRLTVYNLRGVIANMKSVGSLVDIAALMPVAPVTGPLRGCNDFLGHNIPIMGQNAITCNDTKVTIV